MMQTIKTKKRLSKPAWVTILISLLFLSCERRNFKGVDRYVSFTFEHQREIDALFSTFDSLRRVGETDFTCDGPVAPKYCRHLNRLHLRSVETFVGGRIDLIYDRLQKDQKYGVFISNDVEQYGSDTVTNKYFRKVISDRFVLVAETDW